MARARLLIAAAASLGVGLVYADSLNLGLWSDDYLFLRPSSLADVARTFHGTWEPSGILPAFYRPLTIAYQAAVFHVLGFNTHAIHVLSLFLIAVVACLVGMFVSREAGSPRLGAIAAVLYGVHPAIARSEGPWFFLQYHSLTSIVAVVALLLWQRRRLRDGVLSWWPVVALATVGFAVRESIVALLPALVVLQALRARLLRDVPAPSGGVWLMTAAHVVVLVAARQWLLGEMGGPRPDGIDWLLNLIRGPVRTLAAFQPGSWPANQVASVMSVLVLTMGGVVLARARRPRARALLLTGAVFFVMFNLPLVLASSSTRFYLLAMAAVFMLSAAVDGWIASDGYGRYVGYGVVVLLVGSFAMASRAAIAPQHPCGTENLDADGQVMTWAPVPTELRAWVAGKVEACRRGEAPDLASSIRAVVWPRNGRDVVVGLNEHAASATLRVRLTEDTPPSGLVYFRADDGATREETVTGEWRTVAVALSPTWLSRLRRLHRVDVWMDVRAPGALELEATIP